MCQVCGMRDDKRVRILRAARTSFLRYGYRRVSMGDIAEAAGMSRAALYLVFKNKEDIFGAVFLHWVEETIADMEREMAAVPDARDKLALAFEIWSARPFEMVMDSPEARELIECSFAFAQDCLRQGQDRFERTIAPILARVAPRRSGEIPISAERTAHVLASAMRGFKQTATSPAELRQLINDLLALSI